MSKWMNIDNAPKDGTWILGTDKYHSQYYRCRWTTADQIAADYGGDPESYVEECWDNGTDAVCPTLWTDIDVPQEPMYR